MTLIENGHTMDISYKLYISQIESHSINSFSFDTSISNIFN